MRLLVTGGRDYNDAGTAYAVIHALKPDVVIHGAQKGADALCHFAARVLGVARLGFSANWNAHGKSAGPRRNMQMLQEGKPDLCVAFPGGRGTADMVKKCRAAGVPVLFVDEDK